MGFSLEFWWLKGEGGRNGAVVEKVLRQWMGIWGTGGAMCTRLGCIQTEKNSAHSVKGKSGSLDKFSLGSPGLNLIAERGGG